MFVGFPGSGKTMSAIKLMHDSKSLFKHIYDNPLAMCTFADDHITTDYLSKYRFSRSLILIDESSLSGMDNRSWQKNFATQKGAKFDNLLLNQLALVRHYHNAYIVTAQSISDLDSKIRDGNKLSAVYYCSRPLIIGRWYVKATRAIKMRYMGDDLISHVEYRLPGFWERIFHHRRYIFYTKKSIYGKMYDSWATDPRIDNLPELSK